jgi:hypothetical protein
MTRALGAHSRFQRRHPSSAFGTFSPLTSGEGYFDKRSREILPRK